jgi:hypothetical protein
LHAEGPGSIRPLTAAKVRGHGEWRDGHWRVVLNGPRPAGDRFSLAVWSGRNRERAGLKAFAPEWIKMAA